jgi:predicted dehydrogenase
VADVCAARRERARQLLPGARIYDDAAALFAGEAGRLDFIDIATPPRDHGPLALSALGRGLHVLCEKPITVSAREAERVLAAARAARRTFFPVQNYKHAPALRAVREILDSGRLGPLRRVFIETLRPSHARGVAEWLPDWRRTRSVAGGGIAMDHGPHTLYLAFDWLGGEPLAISAQLSAHPPHDTEDEFTCTLTFARGVAHARLTWNAPVRKVVYTLEGERGRLTVVDDELTLALEGAPVESRIIASAFGDASHAAWFGAVLDDFTAAIARDEAVGAEAEQAAACLRVIEAAYASADVPAAPDRAAQVSARS